MLYSSLLFWCLCMLFGAYFNLVHVLFVILDLMWKYIYVCMYILHISGHVNVFFRVMGDTRVGHTCFCECCIYLRVLKIMCFCICCVSVSEAGLYL